jgi:hypothetical protein
LFRCGDLTPAEDASQAELGSLAMPLATIVNGVRYRLATSVFSLSGPVEIDRMQENGNGTILVAALPEGDYEVTLHDGWVLERQAESGFEAVAAELQSPNPRPVRIVSQQTTMVAWMFQTDGEPIALEPPGLFQGNLAVSDSTNPATSVFGDVLATEANHVDALAGIVSIDGSLTLEGNVSSLAALSSLSQIQGDLIIGGTSVSSLAGLDSLVEVAGTVAITNNASLPTCAAQALIARLGIDPAAAEIAGNDDAAACP